jgi:S1-C subfamily serine protease
MRSRLVVPIAAALLIATFAATPSAAQFGLGTEADVPRRHEVLPGLESHELLVDPSEPWYEQAQTAIERTRASAVVVQNAQEIHWPPLSGFVIGPRHVITAHLNELEPGETAPRFLVRLLDGTTVPGVQVAGWRRWDFGVIELESPISAPPIEFGDVRTMRRGDIVLNVGHPSAAGRTGLFVTTVGSFSRIQDGFFVGDISTFAGGSGSPVVDLDGRLIGLSSTGIGFDVTALDRMTVSELRLRSAVPILRGDGAAGAAASTIGTLTEPYRR